jgi:hypothetical protein
MTHHVISPPAIDALQEVYLPLVLAASLIDRNFSILAF